MAAVELGSYVEVAERIVEAREKHPEGSLQPANLEQPFSVVQIGDQTFITVVAAFYRTPDDPRPGIGMAYEVFPGKTNFTRGSELQNAETSAWGRAIIAAFAGDAKKGIASSQEVRNRRAEQRKVTDKGPDAELELAKTEAAKARAYLAAAARQHDVPVAVVARRFRELGIGELKDSLEADAIRRFADSLGKDQGDA